MHVATSNPFRSKFFALLFDDASLSVVTRYAAGQNVVQRCIWIATLGDRDDVVDRNRNGQASFVQTVFAKWILSQLLTAVALPALRVIRPLTHAMRARASNTGRDAMPIAMQVATIGSIRPFDFRLLNFLFPAASISTRQLAAAIFNTG